MDQNAFLGKQGEYLVKKFIRKNIKYHHGQPIKSCGLALKLQ